MARYSEEIIEQVRQSNDIVDIISQYVHLTRKGRNYFGLCPFTMKNHLLSLYHQIGKYFIALDVELEEIHTHF